MAPPTCTRCGRIVYHLRPYQSANPVCRDCMTPEEARVYWDDVDAETAAKLDELEREAEMEREAEEGFDYGI